MTQNNTPRYPCESCGLQTFERNRYFDGKLLVTRDFHDEQAYLRGKDRLHNSQLHGYGTVCGLKVTQHPNPACRDHYVVLEPGLGLDCCGNEIIVTKEQVIDLRQAIETVLRDANRFNEGTPDPTNIYIRLAYTECGTELVPALLDDCGCSDSATEFNRTRESYRPFVDLTPPTLQSDDPIAANLTWQHTLATAHPEAIMVDRELERLYVAEWDGTKAWLRMYDTETHRQMCRLALGEHRPQSMTRSNLGDLIYVAETVEEGRSQIRLISQTELENDRTATAQEGIISILNATDVVRLGVTIREDSLLALMGEGSVLRWSSEAIRSVLNTVQTLKRENAATSATGQVQVMPAAIAQWIAPGNSVTYSLTVKNQTNSHTTFHLAVSDNTWITTLSNDTIASLPPRASQDITVTVDVPETAVQGSGNTATVTVTPEEDATNTDTVKASLVTSVVRPVEQQLSEVAGSSVEPADMAQSPDGRWLVVADGSANRVIALNLSQFDPLVPLANRLWVRELLPGDIPIRVEFSYDGKILYILCANSQRLYRAQVSDRLEPLLPDFVGDERQLFVIVPLVDDAAAGSPPNPRPVDMGNSPRDNWLYVLRCLYDSRGNPLERGEVLLLSVEAMNKPGQNGLLDATAAAAIRQLGVNINGNALFQNLAFLGQRLYVAGESLPELPESESVEGSISILYVDEASCGTFIRRTIEACPTCESAENGIIIATLSNYRWDLPMVETYSEGCGEEQENLIDNLTNRPLVPSTNTLRQVIECMLKKGISEGIPGPRGPVGPKGVRGAGITEVVANSLPPGSEATANLQTIAGDPEGDRRLLLGIPRGQDGTTPPPEVFNQVTNASWHHDEVLPSLDWKNYELELVRATSWENIPSGGSNKVIVANVGSFHRLYPYHIRIFDDVGATILDEQFSPNETLDRELDQAIINQPISDEEKGRLLQQIKSNLGYDRWETLFKYHVEGERNDVPPLGLVIQFSEDVLVQTLHERSAFILGQRPDNHYGDYFRCEFRIPATVEPVDIERVVDTTVYWLIRNVRTENQFTLIRQVGSFEVAPKLAKAVRLVPKMGWEKFITLIEEHTIEQLKVVLRGDWILDEQNRGLDGNHIWPGVPDEGLNPTKAIGADGNQIYGRSSGDGTEGGDWISIIHFRRGGIS